MAKDEDADSKRPSDNKFKNQKLAAWRPLMSWNAVLILGFVIGVVFIPLGVALLLTSESLQEWSIDYTTNCIPTSEEAAEYNNCAEFFDAENNTGSICTCTYNVTLDNQFKGQVYLYYGLTNYYQNHRNFMRGRDDWQLIGDIIAPADLSATCQPYRRTDEEDGKSDGYAPCGTSPNSLFNDTFTLTYVEGGRNESVMLDGTNIAWNSDKEIKFNNPSDWQKSNYTKPVNWPDPVWELDPDNEDNNGYENEDLIVWMRSSAFPSFRKLYRRVVHTGSFKDGLPEGRYMLSIDYAYPVASFDGTKHLVLATTSWNGGKNNFLGIAFIAMGSVYVAIGIGFLIMRLMNQREK